MARYAVEAMEYDLDIIHRPGLSCNTPDLLSRAHMEDDETMRVAMSRGLLEQRVQELLEKPARRALRGEVTALGKEEAERHLQLLVQGAELPAPSVEGAPQTLRELVQRTTDNMQAGTHVPKLGEELYPECVEDDPSMIKAYDLVCPVTRSKTRRSAAEEAAPEVSSEEELSDELDSSAESGDNDNDSSDAEGEVESNPKSGARAAASEEGLPTREELRVAQTQGVRICELVHSIKEAITKEPTDSQRELLSRYAIKDGVLYHRSAGVHSERRRQDGGVGHRDASEYDGKGHQGGARWSRS